MFVKTPKKKWRRLRGCNPDQGLFIDQQIATVWHGTGVVSRTLPGFSGTVRRWPPPHSYDYMVWGARRNEPKSKREVTEGTGERGGREEVNAKGGPGAASIPSTRSIGEGLYWRQFLFLRYLFGNDLAAALI